MIKLLRHLLDKRDLGRRLRLRKIVRQARAEAARKGSHTYWRRAGERTREMFS